MTTELSSVEICSAALIAIGADPISSFEDDSTEAEVARVLYPITVEAHLASNKWTFARVKRTLLETGTTPPPGFAVMWRLPHYPDRVLRILGVWEGETSCRRQVTFQRFGDEVATGKVIDAPVMEFVARVDEAYWPADFRAAVIADLEGRFRGSLLGDIEGAMAMRREAEHAARTGAYGDAQGNTTIGLDTRRIRQTRMI